MLLWNGAPGWTIVGLFWLSSLGCTLCDQNRPPSSEAGSPAVEPLLAFTSRTVNLKVPFGETASEEVWLVGRQAAAARLEIDSVEPAGPEVDVVPARSGGPQGLRLTMTGTHVGTVAGQIVVETGLEKPRTLTLLYSSQVLGSLSVDPTNPFIDLRASGPVGATIRVTSDRKNFRLDSARIVEGPFEAKFGRDEVGHGYLVSVGVVKDRHLEEQRGLLGTLRLMSNDPAEPQKDVPVFALGAANRNVQSP
jgi:hypothetical protein